MQNSEPASDAEFKKETGSPSASVARPHWVRLIKKVYQIDPLVCPRCSGHMRIISFIEDPAIIQKILPHLGLWHTPCCKCVTGTVLAVSGERSDKKAFNPKELGVVAVKLDSKGLEGKIQETMLVRLEGHSAPITPKITGYVSKNFKLAPETADFGVIRRSDKASRGEPKSMELTLINNTPNWVKIRNVTKSSDVIDAQVYKYDLAPRDMTIVKVTLKPGSRPLPKNINASISISTNLEREPTITIPVKVSSN